MSSFILDDAISYLDSDLLANHFKMKEKLKNKSESKKRMTIMRWSAVAAGFVFVVMGSYFICNHLVGDNVSFPANPSVSDSVQLNVEVGIYVNGKLYMPNADLSENATEKNVGSFVGYVSVDNKTITDMRVMEYLPNDGKTNRVIVPYKDQFYVYSFYSYVPDESEDWPVQLLDKAVRIDILDPNYGIFNETIYASLTEIDELIDFLTNLNTKYSQKDLNKYYFDKYESQFREGEIWINENGSIADGGDIIVNMKFGDLVSGESRCIVVILEDNTRISYRYLEGAGVLLCDDFGYILTEEQIEQINHLIGLN